MHAPSSLAVLSLLALLAQDPPPAPPATSTTPLAPGLTYSDAMTVGSTKDFLRGWPAVVAPGQVNAVVEIPAGACDKWEVKLDGVMRWDVKDGKPRNVKYLGYPANYGIVPRALLGKDIGGDGDPLDVLVLGPALPRGAVVPVVVLGTIQLVDAGDKDDKLVAAPLGSPFAACKSLDELDKTFPGVLTILKTWFENYKGPGALQCKGFGPTAEANALVAAACESFTRAESAASKPATGGDKR